MTTNKLAKFNSISGRVIELNVDIKKARISKIECKFNESNLEYECEILYHTKDNCKTFKYTCMEEDIDKGTCMLDLKWHLDREGICWEDNFKEDTMKISGVEERLVNASIYVKNAILEFKNVPCKCTNNNRCDRCVLLEDTTNIRERINDEITKLL